jgi:hypothetical protein
VTPAEKVSLIVAAFFVAVSLLLLWSGRKRTP